MTVLRVSAEELKAALPDTSGDLRLKGLEAEVEIYRDGHGIPHVRAQTVHDAFFGQGFATAQDRLWHMDYDRHRAYGRWAEYGGPRAVADDKTMRQFQIAAAVRGSYDALNHEAKAMLDAYAAGVNAFIESNDSLPIEYRLVDGEPDPWRPWDCLAVFMVRHILMGVFEGKLWRARLANVLGVERAASLLRGYQPGHLLIVPPGAEYEGPALDSLGELSEGVGAVSWLDDGGAGSNNWVVAGSRTASGKPLLAGDPHRGLDTPNVYYQNHVACPDFDAIGLSFPGFPGFPHFGHNAYVAWCVTHASADYQDLYIERFNEGDPTQYEFNGEWLQAETRREVINVRGGQDVSMDVTVTRHGPIIAGDPATGNSIAFKYTATAEPNRGPEAVYQMLRATSADELEQSMGGWVDPCNNFLFADVNGDVGYLMRGKLPVRPMANAWLPVPGWSGEYEWDGFVPFEELPRSRNPETGYIVTANNRIVGHDYPHYIALSFAPEYRARRIIDRIESIENATVEDMAGVHAERVSIPARTYARLLAKVDPLDELSTRAKQELAGWDGEMEREAVAPTIYSAFRLRLHREVFRHLLGDLAEEALGATGRGAPGHLMQLASLLVTMAGENDTSLLPPGTDWYSLAARSLAGAVSDLRDRLGDDMDSWTWGRVHRTAPRHTLSDSLPELGSLLDPPSVSIGGDGDTPQSAGYSATQPFAVTGTSAARYVFDTGDWSNSGWITPLGACGHPGSPHYADQTPVWAEVQLIPMLYDWDRIRSGAESVQSLASD